MAMVPVTVAQFDSLAALSNAGPSLDAEHFPTGSRGHVSVRFPWEVPAWIVDGLRASATAAGVSTWGSGIYANVNTLVVPFESHSPAIIPIVGLLAAVLLGVALGLILITVWKQVEEKIKQSADDLSKILTRAPVVLIAGALGLLLLLSGGGSGGQPMYASYNPIRRRRG